MADEQQHSEQYSEQHRDEYQEGILDDSKQKKEGFFKTWLKIGRDSAMKGLDIGNNAVNQINQTIRSGMEAKYEAEIRKAEVEAKAKYGDGAEADAEIAKLKAQLEEQREKDIAKAEDEAAKAAKKTKGDSQQQQKAAEESAAKSSQRAQDDAEKTEAEQRKIEVKIEAEQGHTEEEWEWVTEQTEDGTVKGKWILRSTK